MLQRFVSAVIVPAVGIAFAAAIVFVIPILTIQQAAPLLLLWCCAPLLWGLWAMFAPSGWVPNLLPQWGALLGLILASIAVLVLDLPHLVFRQSWPLALRLIAPLFGAACYYGLWMIVAVVYRRLAPSTAASAGKSAKAV